MSTKADTKGKGKAKETEGTQDSTDEDYLRSTRRQLVSAIQAEQAGEDEEIDDFQIPFSEDSELGPLTPRSLAALRSLVRYGRRQRRWDTTAGYDYKDWPSNRRAAVMVPLFTGRSGEVNVLLSTRSLDLRMNPGQVALPGGKMDATDVDIEHTARREAFEEIGIPMNKESVRLLCELPPFLARLTPLLVTPIVCLLLDPTVKPTLNLSEVSNVFSHPLWSFLTDTSPARHYVSGDVYNGKQPYRTHYDINWLGGRPYRMFRFDGRLAPIWGFTADILVNTARVAYRKDPEFERKAPGQMKRKELIETALRQLQAGKVPENPEPLVGDGNKSSNGSNGSKL